MNWCFSLFEKEFLKLGLQNGSQGVFKGIVYEDSKIAPSLPKLVLVDFGASHAGRSFFLMSIQKMLVSSVSV